MTPQAIRRRYAGTGPYEEVWFLEAATADAGLWLRYVISHGPRPRAELWAAWFDAAGVTGHVAELPLADLDAANPVFGHGPHWLDANRAVGASGPFAWDLTLEDHGPTHAPYPWTLTRTRLARRVYQPAALDLAVSGTFTVASTTHRVQARGVLGHIWGASNATTGWSWAHASLPGGAVEVIAGRLTFGRVTLPVLASAVLHVDGHTWAFNRTRDLLRTTATWTDDALTVRATRGAATLDVRARLPDAAHTALVRYEDPAGGALYCRNSRMASLTARLTDPSRGVDRAFDVPAAFEIGSRERPKGEVLLP